MRILQSQIKPAEYVRTVHVVIPEDGVTLDDLLKPEMWAHVAYTLRAGDHIEVTPKSGEWIALLFVRSVGVNEARVHLLHKVVFNESPAVQAINPDFEIKFRGRAAWSVIRTADKSVMFEGGSTREAAEAWLVEHEKK